jgi:hypothetical protein
VGLAVDIENHEKLVRVAWIWNDIQNRRGGNLLKSEASLFQSLFCLVSRNKLHPFKRVAELRPRNERVDIFSTTSRGADRMSASRQCAECARFAALDAHAGAPTFCRLPARRHSVACLQRKTPDRMSACRQRAECTRSAALMRTPERRHAVGCRQGDILSPVCGGRRRTECPPADSAQNARAPQRAECTRSSARRMHALCRAGRARRSADMLSAAGKATFCRLFAEEFTGQNLSICHLPLSCSSAVRYHSSSQPLGRDVQTL